MKGQFCPLAVAAVAFCGAVTCADAAKNGAAKKGAANTRSSLAAIQLECFKQQGAFYDPETKRWKMTGTDNNMLSRSEAVTNCVAQKTGKRPEPFLREERIYH